MLDTWKNMVITREQTVCNSQACEDRRRATFYRKIVLGHLSFLGFLFEIVNGFGPENIRPSNRGFIRFFLEFLGSSIEQRYQDGLTPNEAMSFAFIWTESHPTFFVAPVIGSVLITRTFEPILIIAPSSPTFGPRMTLSFFIPRCLNTVSLSSLYGTLPKLRDFCMMIIIFQPVLSMFLI